MRNLPAPRVLISEAAIAQRVEELAGQIDTHYAEADEILLVGVLRGSFIFLADLARRLTVPLRVDFIALSSYGSGVQGGAVRLIMDLRQDIRDRHLLVVEDIVDSGRTLAYLRETLGARRPATLRTCALTRKQDHGGLVPVDYLGFEIPDRWVVGYGLDLADRWRTLPYIGEVDAEAIDALVGNAP